MELDPEIWGPHYWFVFHTISLSYPLHPTNVTKKKYYDLVQNIPLFIPDEKTGDEFGALLEKFPVTPYLDSRESFMKWVNFLHNKINEKLEKPELSMSEALNKYYKHYRPKKIIKREETKIKKKYVFGGLVIILIGSIIVLSKK
jgi:hypothetical protein